MSPSQIKLAIIMHSLYISFRFMYKTLLARYCAHKQPETNLGPFLQRHSVTPSLHVQTQLRLFLTDEGQTTIHSPRLQRPASDPALIEPGSYSLPETERATEQTQL